MESEAFTSRNAESDALVLTLVREAGGTVPSSNYLQAECPKKHRRVIALVAKGVSHG